MVTHFCPAVLSSVSRQPRVAASKTQAKGEGIFLESHWKLTPWPPLPRRHRQYTDTLSVHICASPISLSLTLPLCVCVCVRACRSCARALVCRVNVHVWYQPRTRLIRAQMTWRFFWLLLWDCRCHGACYILFLIFFGFGLANCHSALALKKRKWNMFEA